MKHKSVPKPVNVVLLLLLAFSGCKSSPRTGDSLTEWLLSCDDSAECPDQASCICGVCSSACDPDDTLDPNNPTGCLLIDPQSICAPSASVSDGCAGDTPRGFCVLSCMTSCPDGLACAGGYCLSPTETANDAGGDGAAANDASNCACPGCVSRASECQMGTLCYSYLECAIVNGCRGMDCEMNAECLFLAEENGGLETADWKAYLNLDQCFDQQVCAAPDLETIDSCGS